jgi:putative endonuclease
VKRDPGPSDKRIQDMQVDGYYVYILSSLHNRVLYTGVTSFLPKRVWEHKTKVIKGFTDQYNVDRLVYCERHDDVTAAIKREKQIKRWRRDWKIEMIEKENPAWDDLFNTICS